MFLKYVCILECFGLLSICLAYKLIPIVTEDDVLIDIPANTNVTTGPFVRITHGYYFFEMNVKKNWFEAYQSCHLMDAELLSIETQEEWRDINAYVQEFNIGEFYWTSGTDQGKIGQHVWFANNKPIDRAMWGPNQPDNAEKKEHCVEYNWAKSKTGSWINDRPCDFHNRYICEARQPKTASFVVW